MPPNDSDSLPDGVRLVRAPNASAMTERGTNSWIVGTGEVAVIDPGPAHHGHAAAILSALKPGERVSAIVVTHAHLDHSELAPLLSRQTGAPIFAFGPADAGRNPDLVALGDIGGGEGVDIRFCPDIATPDGHVIAGPGWALEVLHTPGHFGNHICLRWGDDLFSGDHVMGWASSMVSPPDGCMTDYMASLHRLSGLGVQRLFPGHGAPVADAPTRLAELIAHRLGREAEILAALGKGLTGVDAIAQQLYAHLAPGLMGAARRNVLSHLLALVARGQVEVLDGAGLSGHYRLRSG